MAKFEFIEKYKDCGLALPIRKTAQAAGYDFQVAEDTLIPPYDVLWEDMYTEGIQNEVVCIDQELGGDLRCPLTLDEVSNLTKAAAARPTLVPTGVKCQLDPNTYLELSVRSSCPLKYWLVLGNGVGVIDADYYNNPDNEGHIFFQIINMSPFPIILKKGDTIGQGIIKPYLVTEDDMAFGDRQGGFGSTGN